VPTRVRNVEKIKANFRHNFSSHELCAVDFPFSQQSESMNYDAADKRMPLMDINCEEMQRDDGSHLTLIIAL
jgi:hypothetical protein